MPKLIAGWNTHDGAYGEGWQAQGIKITVDGPKLLLRVDTEGQEPDHATTNKDEVIVLIDLRKYELEQEIAQLKIVREAVLGTTSFEYQHYDLGCLQHDEPEENDA